MFSPAWLLYSLLLSHSIGTAFSAQISAPTGAASPTVTGTWVLQKGDPPQASQGFIVQLVNDGPSGEKLEDESTIDPQHMSTGMVKLAATSTGTHRLQIVLPSPSSNLASSSSFDVANLDTTGTEQLDHESGENSSSGSGGNSSDRDSGSDGNSSDGDSPSDNSSSRHSSTKSTSQTSSSVLSSTESHASTPSSQPTSDSIYLQTVNVVSTTSSSSSTFTSRSLTTASSTQMYQTSDTPSGSTGSSIPTDGALATKKPKPNLIAIILSVIFATILSIILLLAAAILICRRRRRRLNSTASADPSESSTIAQQWYNSSRFKWNLQGSAPGDSATPSGAVWDTGTLSDFSTLAPSDSVSRFVSTKNTTTRWHDLKLGYRGGLFEKISASGTGSTGANTATNSSIES